MQTSIPHLQVVSLRAASNEKAAECVAPPPAVLCVFAVGAEHHVWLWRAAIGRERSQSAGVHLWLPAGAAGLEPQEPAGGGRPGGGAAAAGGEGWG